MHLTMLAAYALHHRAGEALYKAIGIGIGDYR